MSEGGLISAGVWYVAQDCTRGIHTTHLLPASDLHEHLLSEHCRCCPIEDPERVDMWAHQAFDGRQDYESPAPGALPRRMKH